MYWRWWERDQGQTIIQRAKASTRSWSRSVCRDQASSWVRLVDGGRAGPKQEEGGVIRGHGGANSIFKKAGEEAGLRINLRCSSSLRCLVFHSAAEESEYSSRVRVLLQMQTAARSPSLEETDWGGGASSCQTRRIRFSSVRETVSS